MCLLWSQKDDQIWSSDFIASIVIMALVIVPVFVLWQNIMTESNESAILMKAEERALYLSDLMLSTPGVPANWSNETVVTVGFTESENILSNSKLMSFNQTDYDKSKALFGYDFTFRLTDINGTAYFEKGVSPLSGNTIVPVSRKGLYNGRIVIMDFSIWY